ncbi:MAG: UDP-N-acetylmuramate--L-alanine ligase [Actinomycetota bacterium]
MPSARDAFPSATVDLSVPRRIHVVGVGGPGMSAVAVLLAGQGHSVSGSDMNDSPVLGRLRGQGIRAEAGHDPRRVEGADYVVFSTAVPADNEELVAAARAGATVVHRSDVLRAITGSAGAVGVAGTHGKTTTSALLVTMLRGAGLDPGFYVGAEVLDLGTGAATGSDGTLVIEADESDGTADALVLGSLLLTNIDTDHLDHFVNDNGVDAGFGRIVARVPGDVVVCGDDARASAVVRATGRQAVTYGFGRDNEAVVSRPVHGVSGISFTVSFRGAVHSVGLPLRGDHNALNCAGALVMAVLLGADPSRAASSVAGFGGVERRFQERGEHHGALLVDDYAHLPAEIAAAIAGARTHPALNGRLLAVFQPNRYHRIAAMAADYAGCFSGADAVFITDIYASGTEPIDGVTGRMVADAVRGSHTNVVWAASRGELIDAVSSAIAPGDLCISMGCGDISRFPDELRART